MIRLCSHCIIPTIITIKHLRSVSQNFSNIYKVPLAIKCHSTANFLACWNIYTFVAYISSSTWSLNIQTSTSMTLVLLTATHNAKKKQKPKTRSATLNLLISQNNANENLENS